MAHVTVQDLGVKFRLDKRREQTLRSRLLHPFARDRSREFWALRHVDLRLSAGDILGITGPNGAGKSTMLQALTGIYQPDEGTIDIQGRVALLALGAGFMHDLSGAENVYLNGAAFGFQQGYIDSIVPRIAEFAGIGDFFYQPVRTYSSGMISRLGFAIAMHLDPDILLIDETLAVGDSAFQKKCEEAIQDMLTQRGRIAVIVSHQMPIIRRLCNKRLHMTRGNTELVPVSSGPPDD